MKRRWRVVLAGSGLLLAIAAAPILTIETRCRSPIEGLDTGNYRPLLRDPAWRRDEARTWLTYPEWHIVYSAEAFGRHLRTEPPSSYAYLRDVRGFWRGLCAMRQASAGLAPADAKVMLYTIGLSFSAELLVKALYENTLGRVSEWVGGWRSADDRYAAVVQARYGAFMNERPWYEFPFGEAFSGLWATRESDSVVRHWERRVALSAEYGVKAGYAKLIGWASGASLGRDERTLRFVVRGNGSAAARTDPRFRVVARGKLLSAIEAPRYAQFTELLTKLAATDAELVEISGNDDIFLTLHLPPTAQIRTPSVELFATSLDQPKGWRRVGYSTKVPKLLDLIRSAQLQGGRVEHVYDY